MALSYMKYRKLATATATLIKKDDNRSVKLRPTNHPMRGNRSISP